MTSPTRPGPSLDMPPRLPALKSFIDLPVDSDHPALVRYTPFGDSRQVTLRRDEERVAFHGPAFDRGRRAVRLGAFDTVIVTVQTVLSPPMPPPGVPLPTPAELEYRYKPIYDVLVLPDAELLIPRSPNGFTDEEVTRLLGRISVGELGQKGERANSAEPLEKPLKAEEAARPPATSHAARIVLGGAGVTAAGIASWAFLRGPEVAADGPIADPATRQWFLAGVFLGVLLLVVVLVAMRLSRLYRRLAMRRAASPGSGTAVRVVALIAFAALVVDAAICFAIVRTAERLPATAKTQKDDDALANP